MDKSINFLKYFPGSFKTLFNTLQYSELNKLNEICIINGQALSLQINGKRVFLGSKGVTYNSENGYIVKKNDISAIFELITRSSSYAYNRFVTDGFLTVEGGHRVGITGNCIVENGKVINLNNINSFCFRIAHDIVPNTNLVFGDIYHKGTVSNTIIISPPGCGKTTFLRGLASQLSKSRDNNKLIKCAIIDERYEIASCENGISSMDIGSLSFVISGCTKSIAIPMVVRSMAPDVILTDELATEDDIAAIRYAKASGCSIIATTHGHDEKNNELIFYKLENIFDKIIILSSSKGPGTVEKIIGGD